MERTVDAPPDNDPGAGEHPLCSHDRGHNRQPTTRHDLPHVLMISGRMRGRPSPRPLRRPGAQETPRTSARPASRAPDHPGESPTMMRDTETGHEAAHPGDVLRRDRAQAHDEARVAQQAAGDQDQVEARAYP